MFRVTISIILTALLIVSQQVHARTTIDYNKESLSELELVGSARLKVLFWKVYDADLYAPSGIYDKEKPFALALTYLRDFKGKDIAKQSIKEIRGQGYINETKLAQWYEILELIIPDVEKNDQIVGVRDSDGNTALYLDDQILGTIEDQEFTQRFFAIWLGEKSSQPKMRRKLIGVS